MSEGASYFELKKRAVESEFELAIKNECVSLSWNHLTVRTKPKKGKVPKQLLNGISGTIEGGMMAIMGASGSGKTTFLSALSLRVDKYRMETMGDLYLNGKRYDKNLLKSMSGYVMQDDLINAHLTVAETLRYAAELRMPPNCTKEERAEMEIEVMNLVGIYHCRDTIVGDTRVKGISGGERKRLCIAMELLTKPKLLFLDEPTSGLDSSTAYSVIKILKGLSGQTRSPTTVVCTIHQPQAKIFALFNSLILMRKGDIVYHGLANKAIDYFASLGYPCTTMTNPADHILDVLTGSDLGLPVESERIEVLHDEKAAPWARDDAQSGGLGTNPSQLDLMGMEAAADASDNPHPYSLRSSSSPSFPPFPPNTNLTIGLDQADFAIRQPLSWDRQFLILLRRNLHLHVRRWDIIFANVIATLLVATFVSMSTWRSLGSTNSSTSRRLPALFYCTIHQGIISSLQGTHSFPLDRSLMLRERSAGTYGVSAYFFAKSSADFVMQVIAPIIFTCVVYPIVGFSPGASKFFSFIGFMILTNQAATSMSNMISCLCVSIELSTVVLACAYEISRLYGGWFIKPADMNQYSEWRFADALSYIKYSFVGIALNENEDLQINCSNPAKTCAAPCLVGSTCTGSQINVFNGYADYSIGFCAGILIVYIVGCKILSYIGLRYIKM